MKMEYSRERLWNYEHEQVFDYQILSPEARLSDESRNSVKDDFGIDDSRKNLVYFSVGGPSFQYHTLKSIVDAFNITTYSVPSVVPDLYRNFSLFYPSINCVPSKDPVSISEALHSIFSDQELLNYINKDIVYKSIAESYSPKAAKSKYSVQKIPSPIRLIVLENIQSLLSTTRKKKENLRNLNFIFNLTDSLPSAEKTVVLLTLDDSQLLSDESDFSQNEKTIRTLVDFKEYLGEQLFHSPEESYFNGNALVGRINRFAIEGKKKRKRKEEVKASSDSESDTPAVVLRDDDNTVTGDSFCSQLVKELQSSSSSFHPSRRPVLTREMIKREDFLILTDNNNNNNNMNAGNNNNTNSVYLFLPYLLIIGSILVFLFFTLKTNTGKKNKNKTNEEGEEEDDDTKSNSRTRTNHFNSSPINTPVNHSTVSPKKEETNVYQLNNKPQRIGRSNNDQEEDDEYFHEEKEEEKEIDKTEEEEDGNYEEYYKKDADKEEAGKGWDQGNKRTNSSNDSHNRSNIGNSNRRRTSEEWNEGYFHEEEDQQQEQDAAENYGSRRRKMNDNKNPFTSSSSSSSFPTQSEPPIQSSSFSSSSSFPSSSHKSPSGAPSLFVSPSVPSQRRKGDHLDLSSEMKKPTKKTTTTTTPGQIKTRTTTTPSRSYNNQATEQTVEVSSVTSSGGMRLRSRRELPPP
jgi:hypothetical protein